MDGTSYFSGKSRNLEVHMKSSILKCGHVGCRGPWGSQFMTSSVRHVASLGAPQWAWPLEMLETRKPKQL